MANPLKTRVFSKIPLLLILTVALVGLLTSTSSPALHSGPINSGDVAWMLTASALVLLMTPGLSFFYGGMVSKKNVISTMMQSFVALGLVSIIWVVVGFSLAFGDSVHGLIGNPFSYFYFRGVGPKTDPNLAPTIPLALFALFQLKFAIITPALITGALAERLKFSSYLLFISLFTIFIYTPLAHWTWHPNGFLHTLGVLDFAGGTVVHMSAGFAALAGAIFIGRRQSHARRELHAPANVPFVILGTGLLWFGWFGFNSGSALGANETAAMAFLTTNTASAAAMLTWLFLDMALKNKPSALGACVGAVVGLVAITPAAGFVDVGASMIIGVVAGVVSNLACRARAKSTIDDTLDVFSCHGLAGVTGMLLTAVFAKDVGLIFGHTHTFLVHLAALGVVSLFVFLGTYLLLLLTDAIIPLRVNDEEEIEGLDISQHGESVSERMLRLIRTEQRLVQEGCLGPEFVVKTQQVA